LNIHIETDLSKINQLADIRNEENDLFIDFLAKEDGDLLDTIVADLNAAITPQIDCTDCGNCCKSLMIVVGETEANDLSDHLKQSREVFDAQYLEKGTNGLMIMKTMPCDFLVDNKCSVYEHRYEGCREFPALHIPHFNKRLFTIFMHYGRCPIIFNVVEALKKQLHFNNA